MHSRLVMLRTRMEDHGLDAFVVSALPGVRYLTGFTGSNALAIVTRRQGYFLTDSRYAAQSREEVRGWVRKIARGDLLAAAVEEGVFAKCRTIGFEPDELSYAQYRRLHRLVHGIPLRPVTDLVADLAVSKDAAELSCIRKAVRITERVYHDILPLIRPGIAERDLATEISHRHRSYGADRDAFEPIVASGPRSALPHARPTSRRIRPGDMVILDFGCRVNGYGSDLTRTVSVDGVRRRTAEMYRVVLEAHDRAIAAVRAGLRASELDAVARESIRRNGYGKYFVHSLGHGLGLGVHERPRIAPLSRDVLREGSVITIEPGIYLPGFGGVRIEDDVLIRARRAQVLSASSTDLTVV